ncbi:hypothetical protein FVEG_16245 [Fusarium verticillioides 7600]|uniref:Uncharacterized protein n=1 Tax=Gibberella moniliformis (strain M3125 / FGSC 7600) TaxID=334819 RepID=W7MV01_GIBM7|nr:hypothetical protein FVEG_16245 [Fusarium verticillioides 7600]EWG48237.1 hypothetical protein FVEG_16245 [Fusarium verticillioides 7600]
MPFLNTASYDRACNNAITPQYPFSLRLQLHRTSRCFCSSLIWMWMRRISVACLPSKCLPFRLNEQHDGRNGKMVLMRCTLAAHCGVMAAKASARPTALRPQKHQSFDMQDVKQTM